MAKSKVQEIPAPVEAVDTEITPSPVPGPIPGTVRLHNLVQEHRDIPLYNGKSIRLEPHSRGGTGHISEAVAKKLLPDAVWKMKKRGEMKIVEEVA